MKSACGRIRYLSFHPLSYFSVPEDVNTNGVDAISGTSVVVKDGAALGNVQYIASIIQNQTSGDLFRIEAVHQYRIISACITT